MDIHSLHKMLIIGYRVLKLSNFVVYFIFSYFYFIKTIETGYSGGPCVAPEGAVQNLINKFK